jgi:hypothetical protein
MAKQTKAPAKAPLPKPATNGSADPRVAELKAELERLGYQVKEKKSQQNVIPELLAELKAVVEKHGGVAVANVKATFVRARKDLWPITEQQRAYNKAQAEKRKAGEA